MSAKTQTIEVDTDTAAMLESRASKHGISVAQLISKLAPLADDSDVIAELDRRWAVVESGEQTVPHDEVMRWLETWGTPGFRPWA